MLRRRLVMVFCIIISCDSAYGQFGKLKDNLLKKGAEVIKKKSINELQELRDKIDTSTVSLAVSFADNAGKYEQNDRLSNLRTFAEGFFLDDVSTDPLQEARESNEMGELFYSMNQFWMAQLWFLSARGQYENMGKTSHPQYFKVISNLGLLYHTMGRYNLADQFTVEALNLRKSYLGENSTATAASLNNMAVIYKDQGLYTDAERLFDQSMSIFLANDPYGSSYAIVINNKAILYQIIGRLGEAEKLLKQSLQLAENNSSLREKSNNYQRILVNLALLYQEKGEFEQAEKIYLDAIKLKEKQLKESHPDYAHLLNNLASLYMLMGRYHEVEGNLRKALEIYEKKFGDEHPSYASTLSNLGKFYQVERRDSEAMSAFQKVVDLRAKIYGVDHPQYVDALEDLAIAYWMESNITRSVEIYTNVLDKELDFIAEYFPPMTENEKAKYWDQAKNKFLRFYAFAASNYATHPELLVKMFEYRMATKALLLNISNKIREEILNGNNEQLKRDYLIWLDKKETLVAFYSYTKEELEKENIDIGKIEDEANELERSLSSRSEVFRKGYSTKMTTYHDVKRSLTTSESLVEIVHSNQFDRQLLPESQYYALIITNSDSYPSLISFDESNNMDTKYYKYYKNSVRMKFNDDNSYASYWRPIDELLAGTSNVYVSFDGIYNQINVNTLADEQGQFMIDKYNIVYLTNSKYVLAYKELQKSGSTAKRATLVGFPDYGENGTIAELPGTKAEVDNIDIILKRSGYSTDKLLTASASEENIKYLYSPSILHIATHGYFLNDDEVSQRQVFGIEPLKASENPLLRSGLLLSNAEQAMTSSYMDKKSSNNGVLTAYEAMNLHLNNTQIVVLSACETGLGDLKSGEGVYGLQRAFQMAGADAVIMSLWKVDDQATKDIMIEFYTEWLRTGEKSSAFRKAQQKAKARYKDPYYWGAFVLIEN